MRIFFGMTCEREFSRQIITMNHNMANSFKQYLSAEIIAQLLSSPSVPQSNCHRSFSLCLTNNVLVQHVNDFPRLQDVLQGRRDGGLLRRLRIHEQ
jgi:hypothetical protein